MTRLNLLDQIFYMEPGPFLAKYGPWIFLFLAVIVFVSIADLALRSHFPNSRARRTLVGAIGTALTLLTYYSIHKGVIEINTAGVAIYALLLIFMIFFFMLFFIARMLTKRGEQPRDALSFTIAYLATYVAAWGVASDFFVQLAEISPAVNGLMALIALLSFLFLLFESLSFFKGNMPGTPGALRKAARGLKSKFTTADTVEADKEIDQDKKEIKLLKKKSYGLTKKELHSVDDIEDQVSHMIRTIKNHGPNLSQDDMKDVREAIDTIRKQEQTLWNSLELIERHVYAYHNHHKKDMIELQTRLKESKDQKQQKAIRDELTYQKSMQQALAFLEKYQTPTSKLIKSFGRFLETAIERLRSHMLPDAITNLEHAHKNLYDLKHIYKLQGSLEKYLIKMDHKLIRDLKKEKAA